MNTWNPWHGCKKVSEGCKNCYMYYLDSKRNVDSTLVHKLKNGYDLPLKKDRYGNYKIKSGETVFVCLTSDFFIDEADEWRKDAWDIMRIRNDVRFQLMTKRPERIKACLPEDWGDGWDNVALDVTTENQRRADERLPILLELPFKTRGIMAAPLLSEIMIEKYLAQSKIDSVTVGGENYDGARICSYDWVKSLYDQCVKYDVGFEFYETGAKFMKDGRVYNIPRLLQREQAVKSGLNYPPYDAKNVVITDKCRRCEKRYMCKGRKDCAGK